LNSFTFPQKLVFAAKNNIALMSFSRSLEISIIRWLGALMKPRAELLRLGRRGTSFRLDKLYPYTGLYNEFEPAATLLEWLASPSTKRSAVRTAPRYVHPARVTLIGI
jgi:hypothetical protein